MTKTCQRKKKHLAYWSLPAVVNNYVSYLAGCFFTNEVILTLIIVI